LGYRAGLNKALARMACRAQTWEDEFQELQDQYETLLSELRLARDERAVEQAANERAIIPDGWLN
jgi:hypothetical protein